MEFREAVTVCFQDFFKFSGRARRPEFWWFFLFLVAGTVLLAMVDAALFGKNRLLGLGGLFSLLTLVPQLTVSWRRMHDTGSPGWFVLLPYVLLAPVLLNPFIGMSLFDAADAVVLSLLSQISVAIILAWLIRPSQPGENRFGPEPPV